MYHLERGNMWSVKDCGQCGCANGRMGFCLFLVHF